MQLKQPYLYREIKQAYKVSRKNPSIFKYVNIDIVVSSLIANSYYLGINPPQNILQEVVDFANVMTCYGNRDPKLSFYYSDKERVETLSNKRFNVGSYLNNIKMCPAVRKLDSDPGLLTIAAKFLGTAPVHVGTELLWSFPISATPLQRLEAAQVFHYDLDDYQFIRFFF